MSESSADDRPWNAEQIALALDAVRQRIDGERRQRFAQFGIPSECYWPASRLYHEHSTMGPGWAAMLTADEVDAFTRDLDYKRYPGAERIALPPAHRIAATLEETIGRRQSRRGFGAQPASLEELATLLALGTGVTQDAAVPRRAAPSPGALYPIETYPLAFRVDGLKPGVYHYNVLDNVLEFVRHVSGFEVMKEFLPPDLFDARPPVVLAFSVVFSRVQTKYLERGYRFALIEAGHIAQNVLLAATALGMNALPVGGFWDEPFNELLGFDHTTEAVIYSILAGSAA